MACPFNVVLDMHSEITCDENYNYHYTDNVENVHLFSPRGLHVKTCTALSPCSTQRDIGNAPGHFVISEMGRGKVCYQNMIKFEALCLMDGADAPI